MNLYCIRCVRSIPSLGDFVFFDVFVFLNVIVFLDVFVFLNVFASSRCVPPSPHTAAATLVLLSPWRHNIH